MHNAYSRIKSHRFLEDSRHQSAIEFHQLTYSIIYTNHHKVLFTAD